MSKYEPRIKKDGTGGYYALVVRVERNGYEVVSRGYEGRYFKTKKAAVKSTVKFISNLGGV